MGSKWVASSPGPDWTDVMITMKAIEVLHSVSLALTITPTAFDGPSGFITLSARKVTPHGEASVLGEPIITSCGEWPCRDHKELTACVYAALLTFDYQLSSKVWEQKKLAFTPA